MLDYEHLVWRNIASFKIMVCNPTLSFRSHPDPCKQVQSGTFTMLVVVDVCDPSGCPTLMTVSFDDISEGVVINIACSSSYYFPCTPVIQPSS